MNPEAGGAIGPLQEDEPVGIVALCLGRPSELWGALQAVLQACRDVEMVWEDLSGVDIRRKGPAILDSLVTKLRPNLLLVCVPSEDIDCSETVFKVIRKQCPEIPTIAILNPVPFGQLHRLIGFGVADFCLPPLTLENLLPRLVRWSSVSAKPNLVTRQLQKCVGFGQFLGQSQIFLEAVNKIPKFARCDAGVLITGETGTGKEMCARSIHHLGPRMSHPFVPVNCGAIPSELVENELFGHEAGAFTGASSSMRGLVHDAEGGTLFLDEIDSLPLPIQVKFLRFLQDQEFRPLGARKTWQADIRVIAASNTDIEGAVRAGRFRSDLFYRLNVLPLKLPALRERAEDIPLLARHFLTKYARKCAVPVKELSTGALERLSGYDWPGNVRELQNVIERAVVLSERQLITREEICLPAPSSASEEVSFKDLKQRAIDQFETGYIRQLLATHEGNITKAARAAKKNRRAFWQIMRKHDIVASSAVVAQ